MLTWDDPARAEPDLSVYTEHLLLQPHRITPHTQQVSHRVDEPCTMVESIESKIMFFIQKNQQQKTGEKAPVGSAKLLRCFVLILHFRSINLHNIPWPFIAPQINLPSTIALLPPPPPKLKLPPYPDSDGCTSSQCPGHASWSAPLVAPGIAGARRSRIHPWKHVHTIIHFETS